MLLTKSPKFLLTFAKKMFKFLLKDRNTDFFFNFFANAIMNNITLNFIKN